MGAWGRPQASGRHATLALAVASVVVLIVAKVTNVAHVGDVATHALYYCVSCVRTGVEAQVAWQVGEAVD